MKDIQNKLRELGRLIKEVRNYTKDDLEYIAYKLEKGYDELWSLFGEEKKE